MSSRLSGSPFLEDIFFIPTLLLLTNTNAVADTDECKTVPGICGENAECINLRGFYRCQCIADHNRENGTCVGMFRISFQLILEMGSVTPNP